MRVSTWQLIIVLLVMPIRGLHILSCFYGFSECVGFQRGDGVEKARELGCPVSASGDGFAAQTQRQVDQMFNPMLVLMGVSLRNSESIAYGDGMPCTFDIADNDLHDIELSDVSVTLTDNSKGLVTGATWAPALGSDKRTLLLIGSFGFRDGLRPQEVEIAGARYTGPDLQYRNNGVEMVYARWFTLDDYEALGWDPQDPFNPDDCRGLFPETTHVVQVAFSGGMTVTYENNPELPTMLTNEKHKSMFELRMGDLALDQSEYLGMADIQNNDNYLDLCLALGPGRADEAAAAGLTVRVYSTRDCYFLVPPRGDCENELVSADCGDSATHPHAHCVSGVPGAGQPCQAATATPFEITATELAGLACPGDLSQVHA